MIFVNMKNFSLNKIKLHYLSFITNAIFSHKIYLIFVIVKKIFYLTMIFELNEVKMSLFETKRFFNEMIDINF